jgi:hypothetical protein
MDQHKFGTPVPVAQFHKSVKIRYGNLDNHAPSRRSTMSANRKRSNRRGRNS